VYIVRIVRAVRVVRGVRDRDARRIVQGPVLKMRVMGLPPFIRTENPVAIDHSLANFE
jgi:hypothetical protein